MLLVRRFALAAVVVCAAVVFPVSASATTTIGSNVGPHKSFFDSTVETHCSSGYVWTDSTYVVPAGGGEVTAFSYRAYQVGDQVEFHILRPDASQPGFYEVVGSSGLQTLATDNSVETFALTTPIPVEAGGPHRRVDRSGRELSSFYVRGCIDDSSFIGSSAYLLQWRLAGRRRHALLQLVRK